MEKAKTNDILVMLTFAVLALGVMFGSIYMSKLGEAANSAIHEYLNNFVSAMQQGTNNLNVFKNSLRGNIILAAILFISGFFRFGIAVTAGMIIRKGFIIGFTASSFVKFYGIKGLLCPQTKSEGQRQSCLKAILPQQQIQLF